MTTSTALSTDQTMALSAEALASIIFGILQLTIGLVALWQQHRFRQLHRESLSGPLLRNTNLLAYFRFEGRRRTV